MIVGIPREIKRDEYRVAILPVGVEEFVQRGHQVIIEAGAGLGSGLPDEDYRKAGATLVPEPAVVFEQAELILKVKEPLESEWPLIRPGQSLFTYFHFAASRELTDAMLDSGATCVASSASTSLTRWRCKAGRAGSLVRRVGEVDQRCGGGLPEAGDPLPAGRDVHRRSGLPGGEKV